DLREGATRIIHVGPDQSTSDYVPKTLRPPWCAIEVINNDFNATVSLSGDDRRFEIKGSEFPGNNFYEGKPIAPKRIFQYLAPGVRYHLEITSEGKRLLSEEVTLAQGETRQITNAPLVLPSLSISMGERVYVGDLQGIALAADGKTVARWL